jgi:hypothetical protein
MYVHYVKSCLLDPLQMGKIKMLRERNSHVESKQCLLGVVLLSLTEHVTCSSETSGSLQTIGTVAQNIESITFSCETYCKQHTYSIQVKVTSEKFQRERERERERKGVRWRQKYEMQRASCIIVAGHALSVQ